MAIPTIENNINIDSKELFDPSATGTRISLSGRFICYVVVEDRYDCVTEGN